MKYLGSITDPKDLVTKEYVDNVSDMIADEYSGSATYSVGDYCTYNGNLYKCTTAITTAETWDSSHWTQVQLGDEVSDLKSAFGDTAFDILALYTSHVGRTHNDITFTYDGDSWVADGTASAQAFVNIWGKSQGLPPGVEAGKDIFVKCSSDDVKLRLFVYFYNGDTQIGDRIGISSNTVLTVPSDCDGVTMRINVDSGAVLNNAVLHAEFYPSILFNIPYQEIANSFYHGKTASTNTPTGFTFFRQSTAGYSDVNNLKPSDIPKNSYLYTLGNTLDDNYFPNGITYTAGGVYWIFCWANTIRPESSASIRGYLIIEKETNKRWYGYSNDGGANVTWVELVNMSLLYHGKNQSYNTPSGFTFFRTSTAGFDSTNKMKPSNIPKNSYCYVMGNVLDTSEFPSEINFSSGVYWVLRISNTTTVSSSGAASEYFIFDKNSKKSWRGSTTDGGATAIDWLDISSGNTYNNSYPQTITNNTYNVTATPEISTDTNNFLAASGDDTDRTTDIETMLNTYGVCNLGPGDFYVSGITVPERAELRGNKSRIILKDSVTDGFAVKLLSYSCVANLRIVGQTDGYTPVETVGARHGILIEGQADTDGPTVYKTRIDNCRIQYFNGGGITCRNTGTSPAANALISNCFIDRCDAGINISYFSEFNRITGCAVLSCFYGCVNNGGNNVFVNCDFTANTVGILMDNSNRQSPNNSHGTFSACTINHTGGNTGTAIKILGMEAGEIFNGCQLWYGNIEIEGCRNVRFCNMLIGRTVNISIKDSYSIIFSNCAFRLASEITFSLTGTNTNCKCVECYDREGATISMS